MDIMIYAKEKTTHKTVIISRREFQCVLINSTINLGVS